MIEKTKTSNLGVVIIGRNEGDRLTKCIKSIGAYPTVYVDSGSTDDSVSNAINLECSIVELDMSIPFSAARARNAGFELITTNNPELEYIQFVDGDCEIVDGWLENGSDHLNKNPDISVVCGRRRERFPDASIYNYFCDIEWNTPVGAAKSTGGDFMVKVSTMKKVGGFNPSVVAGEEPELCYRIRQNGEKIYRIAMDMTLHDANMHYFSQWWKRTERSGHAYAHCAWLHGKETERFRVRALMSILIFGAGIPIIIFYFILTAPIAAAVLATLYPVLVFRVFAKSRDRKSGPLTALYSTSIVLGKIPQSLGVARFFGRQISGRGFKIIEYK